MSEKFPYAVKLVIGLIFITAAFLVQRPVRCNSLCLQQL